MKLGMVKVASVSPKNIFIGNPDKNTEEIIRLIKEIHINNVNIAVFPELCITGYTCGDLFFQQILLNSAIKNLVKISKHVENELVFVGIPLRIDNELFNCAAVLNNKEIIAIIPKTYIPNYNEFYEMRYFSSSNNLKSKMINIDGKDIPVGNNILIRSNDVVIGCEICEDAWVPIPPSAKHCLKGANIIVNLSASNEIASKNNYRKNLIKMLSATNICGYIYSSASKDESTSDTVFSGCKIIAENGNILNETVFLDNSEIIYSQIDIDRLIHDRTLSTSYLTIDDEYVNIKIDEFNDVSLERTVSLTPFIPKNLNERAEEILNIQASGLSQRLKKINCKKVVIGISGGLDSTLALLTAIRAFDMINLDKKGIIGITMPGFGTTNRTLDNSLKLMEYLEITSRTISIKDSCIQHLKNIGHPDDVYDSAYENVQARERTQILMDVANQENAIVIGTGDLSELALGWCTYNGDHMSMYSVNNSIPKTLVRHLVKYYADVYFNKKCIYLYDILDTPISPELLPPDKNGNIVQKTEESIGNYNIHDFILYYTIRFGFSPIKIYKLFINSSKNDDDWKDINPEYLIKNIETFFNRFFNNQFKRNCVPDGIKVGSVSLSPRADWRMPSDANKELWMKEIDELKNLTFKN